MIKNYFKIAWRNIRNDKIYASVNIVGLIIGICASWIIFSIVYHEFSYDHNLPNGEQIYQVVSHGKGPDGEATHAGVSEMIYPLVENEIPDVELTARVTLNSHYYGKSDLDDSSPIFDPQGQIQTTAAYFDLITYTWLAGRPETALNAPNKVVLTASRARAYFEGLPLEEIYGKTITYNDSLVFQVSGIIADFAHPNSFVWNEIFLLPNTEASASNWNEVSVYNLLYVRLKNGAKADRVAEWINKRNNIENVEQYGDRSFSLSYILIPLKELHFANDVLKLPYPTINKSILWGLVAIASFLILLACINYMNLTTARIPSQSKNIGIRKSLGMSKRQLIVSFAIETFIIAFIAAVFSVVIAFLLQDALRYFMPDGVYLFDGFTFKLVLLLVLICIIVILSTIYPSWVILRVSTIDALRNKIDFSARSSAINIRKSLVVFQFVISLVFTVCTIIMGYQIHYTMNKDLGFNHQALINIEIPFMLNISPENYGKMFLLQQELSKYPQVESVALGDIPMTHDIPATYFRLEGSGDSKEYVAGVKFVDADYIDVYNMRLLAGKNIVNSDSASAYLITDNFRRTLGIASVEDAIGTMLYNDYDGKTLPITGVIADFHQLDLTKEMRATVLMPTNYRMNTANIKLESSQPKEWEAAIDLIEKEWNILYPNIPFRYEFYDKKIEAMYVQERLVGMLAGLATGTTLLISCLGLFGLATLTASQRTKEIGIRKVLGASVWRVVAMLSQQFVKLVLLAIIIASPIAWWAMNNWLEDFVYRIEVQWWMFALAGLMAVTIALITVSYQAICAALANPVDSLRDE